MEIIMNPEKLFRIETDENLMETALHGDAAFPFKLYLEDVSEFDFHCIDWHWHTEFEFVYVETGAVEFNVSDARFILSAGNGIFINTRILHRMYSEDSAYIPNFLCLPSFIAPRESLIYEKYIQPLLGSASDYLTFSPEIPWQREILSQMQAIIHEGTSEAPNELQISILLQQLMLAIYSHAQSCNHEDKKKASDTARLQIMMQFIHNHYAKSITLDDIAASASIGKSTALNLFQKSIETSPVNYLIKYRLKICAERILNTEKKISAIAQEAGFNNVDYFCKTFKRIYGLTPSEYRKSGNIIARTALSQRHQTPCNPSDNGP